MPRDLVDAACGLLCLAMCAVGALVALAGCDEAAHGGGEAAVTAALVGLALLTGGAGGAVLLAGGGRG
jgi:hypothetical protein